MNKARAIGIGLFCLCALFFAVLFTVMHRGGVSVPPAPAAHVDVASVRARADAGEARAQWELGGLYARGEGVNAQAALGELYQAGQGVPNDLVAASKWFHLAAAQRNIRAQYSLGFMCETGRGLPKDDVQAAKWYTLAAEQGDPLAQYDLGQRYDLGVGVSVDRVEALKWLSLAAAQGQTDSAERLKKIKDKMTHKEISEAKRRVSSFSPSRLSAPSKEQ
jgi:hypothetical protein